MGVKQNSPKVIYRVATSPGGEGPEDVTFDTAKGDSDSYMDAQRAFSQAWFKVRTSDDQQVGGRVLAGARSNLRACTPTAATRAQGFAPPRSDTLANPPQVKEQSVVRLYQEEDGEAAVKEEKSWATEQSKSAKKPKKVKRGAALPSTRPHPLPPHTPSNPPRQSTGGKRKSAGEVKKAAAKPKAKAASKAKEAAADDDVMDTEVAAGGAEEEAEAAEDNVPKSAKKAKKAPKAPKEKKEKKEKASKKRAADDGAEPKVRGGRLAALRPQRNPAMLQRQNT